MVRGALSLALAIVLLASPSRAYGGQVVVVAIHPGDVSSAYVYGPGVGNLTFDGQSDEHGLVWSIHEPRSLHEPWAVSVYNASEVIVSQLTITLEFQVDRAWYPVTRDARERVMTPIALGPSDIAYTDAGTFAETLGAISDWDDVRVVINFFKRGSSDLGTPLTVDAMEMNRTRGYRGIVVNTSEHSISDITFAFACVDRNGRIVDHFSNALEVRRLRAGEKEAFHFSAANGSCDSESEVMVSVDARIRTWP